MELRTDAQVTRIEGEDRVTGIVVVRVGDGPEETVPVDAVFIETGSIAAEEFTGGLVQVNGSG